MWFLCAIVQRFIKKEQNVARQPDNHFVIKWNTKILKGRYSDLKQKQYWDTVCLACLAVNLLSHTTKRILLIEQIVLGLGFYSILFAHSLLLQTHTPLSVLTCMQVHNKPTVQPGKPALNKGVQTQHWKLFKRIERGAVGSSHTTLNRTNNVTK